MDMPLASTMALPSVPSSRRVYLLALIMLALVLQMIMDGKQVKTGWLPADEDEPRVEQYKTTGTATDALQARNLLSEHGYNPLAGQFNRSQVADDIAAKYLRSAKRSRAVPRQQQSHILPQNDTSEARVIAKASHIEPIPQQSSGEAIQAPPISNATRAAQQHPPSMLLQHDDTSESFSACILVMDENHRLPEWLAYHYYALPLRYLVIAVDPNSITSPSEILAQWKGRMEIVQWTDSDFTDKTVNLKRRDRGDDVKSQLRSNLGLHRKRQAYFYERCAKFLQAQNRSWTTFQDLDEYIAPNSDLLGKNMSDHIASQPGYVLKAVNELRAGSFALDRNESVAWTEHFNNTHCIPLPRAIYSSKESNDTELRQGVPGFIDPHQFDTLRFRYRTGSHQGRGPKDLVKSILDVSQLAPDDFAKSSNPHLPLKRRCAMQPWMFYNESPLGFHHYIGSWEAYSYRTQDARQGGWRTYDNWKRYATVNAGGPSNEGRPWIQGFVDLVGEDTARQLLRDAGLPRDTNVTETTSES